MTSEDASPGGYVQPVLSAGDVADEAVRIVAAADSSALPVRVLGGIGIWLSLPSQLRAWLVEEGRSYEDIDCACRASDRARLPDLMVSLGYEPRARFNAQHGDVRHIYEADELKVDFFFDRLRMCHTLPLSPRLDAAATTLPLADLLLQKLQIVELNQKDLLDLVALLAAHDLSDDDTAINVRYISGLLAADWGFWHTARTTLETLAAHASQWRTLSDEQGRAIERKTDALRRAIDEAPKTAKWKLRSRIGTKVRWYEIVEDV